MLAFGIFSQRWWLIMLIDCFTVSHKPAIFTPGATFPHTGNWPITSFCLISTNGAHKTTLGQREEVCNVAGCLISVIIYVSSQIRQPGEFWERKPFWFRVVLLYKPVCILLFSLLTWKHFTVWSFSLQTFVGNLHFHFDFTCTLYLFNNLNYYLK